MAKESRAKSAMSGEKKSKKKSKKKSGNGKHVHKMTISHAHGGKYQIDHDYGPENAPDEMPHQAANMDELTQHVQDHMQPPEQEPEQPQPAQPAAGSPTGGAVPGM